MALFGCISECAPARGNQIYRVLREFPPPLPLSLPLSLSPLRCRHDSEGDRLFYTGCREKRDPPVAPVCLSVSARARARAVFLCPLRENCSRLFNLHFDRSTCNGILIESSDRHVFSDKESCCRANKNLFCARPGSSEILRFRFARWEVGSCEK